jgi:hypothetical protein
MTIAEPSAQQAGPARISVVVPGDRSETVRRVREALRRQTMRSALEVIIVRWPGDWSVDEGIAQDGFAAVRVVEVAPGATLPEARAAGARRATAPLVFIAETHAYPRPEWAESVLAVASSGQWQIVSSSFANANPDGPVSWAGFILDYGAYFDDFPAGEIESAPIHKGVYLREDLLALGDRLAPALSSGDELVLALRASGRKVYFEPRARIDHCNVPSLPVMLRGRFLIGFLIGANRSERWTGARRAAYAALSPAIAAVLAWRTWPVARRIARTHPLPRGTHAMIVLGSIGRAAGEAVGYAFGHLPQMQARADQYELLESVYAGDPR